MVDQWWLGERGSLEAQIEKCIESGDRRLRLGYGSDDPADLLDEQLNLVAERLPDVEYLDLSLDDEESATLFCRRVVEFPNLQKLALGITDLGSDSKPDLDGDAVIRTLVDHPAILPLIQYLQFISGDDGYKVFASAAEHFTGLEEIEICPSYGLTDIGVMALAEQAKHFVKLGALSDQDEDLAPGWIGPEACKSLLNFTQFNQFDFGSGRWVIDDEWLEELARRGKEFTRLKYLDFRNTKVGNNGVEALARRGREFTCLTSLGVERTKVTDKGIAAMAKHANNLPNLRSLDLEENRIGDAGAKALAENAGNLRALGSLMLRFTNVGDEGLKSLALAWHRGEFDRLGTLSVNGPSFDALEWMEETGEWRELDPRVWPPRISIVAPEVLGPGNATQIFEAVLDGLSLPEAKLVVLGEPGVGKTSLCRRLFLGRRVDPSRRRETHDFELIIPEWQPEVKSQEVRLRVWDFGGQHVLHGTHEMFLTERSVCLLVLDATQVAEYDPDCLDEERDGNRLSYWLKMIRHFVGPDAHVILVVTKSDEPGVRLPPIDAEGLRLTHEFNRPIRLVPEFSATEKSHEPAVENLRQEIHDVLELVELPRVSRKFAALKEHIESKLEGRAFVPLEEYRQWCGELGITRQSDQDDYLRTLHHFGSVFFFGLLDRDLKRREQQRARSRRKPSRPDDLPMGQLRLLKAERDSVLQHWLINPHWLKRPLYRLIRLSAGQQWISEKEIRKDARRKTGQITIDDPNVAEDILLAALKLTELCFHDRDRGKYFFPRGLSRESGAFLTGWDEASRHEVRWKWDFFPEVYIHRLIVRAHERGEVLNQAHWRTGVVLHRDETMVAVQSEPENGLVKVWIKKRLNNAARPTHGDERFLQRIYDQLSDLVGREPGEESRSWEGADVGAGGDGRGTDLEGSQADPKGGPVNTSPEPAEARKRGRKTGRPKKDEKDSATKVIAALSKHHGYSPGGSVLNYEPATNRDLASRFDLSENALSRFLKSKFDGTNAHKQYVNKCRNTTIGTFLALWNGESPSHIPLLRDDE